MKLYHMLEHLEATGLANIISFQPHGRALRIHLHQRFLDDILPQHFPDINNIASFLRQLNIYGFRRMITNGPDRDSYFHAMFLRGRPDLCSLIERPMKSQYSKRQKYDPTTEPKFYTMPPIHLLPGCSNTISPHSPHSEQTVHMTESKIPAHPSKSQQNLSQASWDDDVKIVPATLAPTHSTESLLQSTSTIRPEIQDFTNNCLVRFDMPSCSADSDVVAATSIAEAPIASSACSGSSAWPSYNKPSTLSGCQQPIKKVPANVVAAATSLLATEYNPRLSIDAYCRNLAAKILKESSDRAPVSADTKQDVPVDLLQRNDR